MKNKKQINKIWCEHIASHNSPTQDQIDKDVLETLYTEYDSQDMTNFAMYKKITSLFDNTELVYEIINQVFELENRTEKDLKNLKEFILCVTLMCGQDVLKAQVRNDKAKEKIEIGKHKKRCDLMTIINQAIDSVIATCD